MIRDYGDMSLEEWASLPLEELQAAELATYGYVFSTKRSNVDTPIKNKKRKITMPVPTKRDVAELEVNQPAWPPAGNPDPRWGDAELTAYITGADFELAQQPVTEPLDLQSLSNRQLERLANATTKEEAAAIEDAIRAKRMAKPR